MATIVGIDLFGEEAAESLRQQRHRIADRLALLPKAVHAKPPDVDDDF